MVIRLPDFFSLWIGILVSYWIPPAHPVVRIPSSSESILISIRPLSNVQSTAFAPVIPTSSSMVNRASIGGCAISLLSSTAITIATAIQSSPPSVVSLAFTKPSSTYNSRASFVKSWADPGFFSQTMSRCPWRITGFESSYPGVPGFLIMTFPTLS